MRAVGWLVVTMVFAAACSSSGSSSAGSPVSQHPGLPRDRVTGGRDRVWWTSAIWGFALGRMSSMMETMGRTKRPRRSFTKEFKAEVVALVRQPTATVASVARDLDLTETAVRAWVKQADIDDGAREGLTSAQLDELAHLRKENRVLREERDILKRATAFFARETR